MNTLRFPVSISAGCVLLALLVCCGPSGNRRSSKSVQAAVPSAETEPQAPPEEVFSLCNQTLTSWEAVLGAFPDGTTEWMKETTPSEDAFYMPADDIKNDPFVRKVELRYNYTAVLNQVVHSLEWFQRKSTIVDEDSPAPTHKDTLEWIRLSQPDLPASLLKRALPDAKLSKRAEKLVELYRRFDGHSEDGSPFERGFHEYTGAFSMLDEIVTQEEIDAFSDGFWEWYDKRNLVGDIDELILMSLEGKDNPSDKWIYELRQRVLEEKDIDKRTILALEYVKFHRTDGILFLGEILESGIYTPHLLEAWISWRANVQMEHSPSSFSVIANHYYDKLRVLCMDTMVRHILKEGDWRASCLLENLILCEIVHRMGSIAGNSSFKTCADLEYGDFIHPRLLQKRK